MRVRLGYSHLDLTRGISPDENDPRNEEILSAENRAHARLRFDATSTVSFEVHAYYVDELPVRTAPVDSYTRVDARLAWRPQPGFEASLVIRNALDERHLEFKGDPFAIPTEIERSFFGKSPMALLGSRSSA